MMMPDLLTEFERAELREGREERVYWDGHTADKPRAPLLAGDNNHGYDDERGDYRITPHDHLQWRYEIISLEGKGSFGQVVKAYDHREGRTVAVKVVRNKARFHKQGLVEVRCWATCATTTRATRPTPCACSTTSSFATTCASSSSCSRSICTSS